MGPDEHGELQELPTGFSRAVHTLLKKLSPTLLRMLSLPILINKDLVQHFLPCLPQGNHVVGREGNVEPNLYLSIWEDLTF